MSIADYNSVYTHSAFNEIDPNYVYRANDTRAYCIDALIERVGREYLTINDTVLDPQDSCADTILIRTGLSHSSPFGPAGIKTRAYYLVSFDKNDYLVELITDCFATAIAVRDPLTRELKGQTIFEYESDGYPDLSFCSGNPYPVWNAIELVRRDWDR